MIGEQLSSQRASGARAGDHWVKFYTTEEDLLVPLSRYFARGIAQGDALLLLAGQSRAKALRAWVGVEPWDEALSEGRLFVRDSGEIGQEISSGGLPDEARFQSLVLPLLGEAKRKSQTGKVRAFGDVVSSYSARGQFRAASLLEGFWSRLLGQHPLSLGCAYPLSHFKTPEERRDLMDLCRRHSHVECSREGSKHATLQVPLPGEELVLVRVEKDTDSAQLAATRAIPYARERIVVGEALRGLQHEWQAVLPDGMQVVLHASDRSGASQADLNDLSQVLRYLIHRVGESASSLRNWIHVTAERHEVLDDAREHLPAGSYFLVLVESREDGSSPGLKEAAPLWGASWGLSQGLSARVSDLLRRNGWTLLTSREASPGTEPGPLHFGLVLPSL